MPTLNDLGKKVKSKYPGQYDDMSDLEVGRRTLARYPTEYADFSGVDSSRVMIRPHERGKPKRKSRLPHAEEVGGAIGGLLGPVGSGLGGGIGEAANRLVTDTAHALETGEGVDPLDTIKDVTDAGARQAALGFVGGKVAQGAAKVGTKLMGAALKASPEVAQTAVKHGITHTKAGLEKVSNKLGELGARTMGMLRNSTANGVRFNPEDFLAGAENKLIADLAENRLPAALDDREMFEKLGKQFLDRNLGRGKGFTPIELQQIKQAADKAAAPVFAAIKRKQPLAPGQMANARWHKAVSDYAREQLEATTDDIFDPATGQMLSLKQANAETKAVIELLRTLKPPKMSASDAALRSSTRPLAMAGAGAVAGAAAPDQALPGNRWQQAMLGAAVGAGVSPTALSGYALAANSPLVQLLISQLPRAGAALVPEETAE